MVHSCVRRGGRIRNRRSTVKCIDKLLNALPLWYTAVYGAAGVSGTSRRSTVKCIDKLLERAPPMLCTARRAYPELRLRKCDKLLNALPYVQLTRRMNSRRSTVKCIDKLLERAPLWYTAVYGAGVSGTSRRSTVKCIVKLLERAPPMVHSCVRRSGRIRN
ncbi:hypothetical protein J6590_083727 [Homalodisca vitripennis]|nr:hypothetical protein J6590_083727 [Homalodisca vitripennis]